MSKSLPNLPSLATLLSGQNIVFGGIIWSVVTFWFFALFSIPIPGEENPLWYLLGTYALETLPFILATWLCYRNWKSPQIASGRDVWLFIGLGLGSYSIGNFLFGMWELYFNLDPEISPADLFYISFTICVGFGMILAVLPRRLNLEPKQWLIVGGVAVLGTLLAVWLKLATINKEEAIAEVPPTPSTEAVQPAPAADPNAPAAVTAPAIPAAEAESEKLPPGWVMALDEFLVVFATPVNLFYSISDVALMVIAATLLMAFWGGRFSQSWRMIGAAALAKYVADLAFYVALSLPGNYESGGLMDVFYVFSGVLYSIGAALEYDVSTSRSGRGRRRRGGG
ncbi:hypothetical protein [Spirulina major]|uniref:hypothetical protein n=1 Tax=Spirulina major TaxID=270636 RepID=UPI0009354217|nr:hypothetical protein [Spirulina major]